MKNYQKNSRNPSVPFSCMLEQLIAAVYHKSINGHLFNHIWSLNLNFIFKPTSFNLLLVALAQTTAYCHVTFMHHIVALHWSCFFCVCRCCSPSVDVVPMMWSLTLMKPQYYLQKCQASKTPLFIPIQTHSLTLLSFTALGQERHICYLMR